MSKNKIKSYFETAEPSDTSDVTTRYVLPIAVFCGLVIWAAEWEVNNKPKTAEPENKSEYIDTKQNIDSIKNAVYYQNQNQR